MKRVVLVGAGGWARQKWVDGILADFGDRLTVTGVVDIDENTLRDTADALGVPEAGRFTEMEPAFESVEADICMIATPPAHHARPAILAAQKGMHILSEKPISDRHGDIISVYKAVTDSGVKMAVTQNYRFEIPILTMREVLRSGDLGRLHYMVGRYAHDYRAPGSWRVDHVHTRDYPLLIEGSIHHLDMLRNLSGSNCDTIMGYGWNPEWSNFKGVCSCLLLMQMENGVKAVYEGNSLEAGQLNHWFHEAYRVECEKGAIGVDRDQVVRIHRRDDEGNEHSEVVTPVAPPQTGHNTIVSEFLDWLDGGEPPETQLADNIHSAALLFAAIDAITCNEVKRVSDYLP